VVAASARDRRERMMNLVLEGLEDYCRAHTAVLPELYERLRAETFASVRSPQMQVGQLEGRLLKLLTQLAYARKVVEVGTFTGYSGLSIAEGLPEGGELHTFDIDPVATAVARRYWAQAPWAQDKITLHLGDARTLLGEYLASSGPIDMAFIDADKGGYIGYWDTLVPAVRPGGLIIADNVLWSGRVLAPVEDDDHHIVAFNRHVAADSRVEAVMLTVRDGIFLARKR